MIPRPVRLLLVFAALLMAGSALAANTYQFECPPDRYASVPLGDFIEFPAHISAIPPEGIDVEVIFEAYVPPTWLAQWCHQSSGVCYFGNETITLPGGVNDAIKVGFIPDWENPGVGYANVIIRSVADQYEIARCSFTCFNGLPVPADPQFIIDCSDNTKYLEAPEDVEFSTVIENFSDQPDSIIVHLSPEVPGGWVAQFCQVSTGICFIDDATLEIAANSVDTLRVDFLNTDFGQGYADLTYQGRANPSIAKTCHYQVFVGDFPADAPETAPVRLVTMAQPNPFTESTIIRLASPTDSPARLEIFGADGRSVRTFDGLGGSAVGVRWDGRADDGQAVPSGVYFYRFQAGSETAKGMIVRTR